MYSEEILNKVTNRIIDKYFLDEPIARDYAIRAIQALESHGGSSTDIVSLYSVVDIVIKSWIDQERK